MGQRPDGQRVEHGADADRPAEQPTHAEHGDLDRGTGAPDGQPTGGQPGHQPVAGARPHTGTDVETGRDAGAQDAADQERHLP